MDDKDLRIQELKAENEKLKKQLEEMKESALDPIEMCKVKIALDKLKEYEERGILPPCEVGDTVYDIFMGEIKEKKVVSVGYFHSSSVKQITVHVSNERSATTPIELERFGKTVFLTEQEAQSALEKMKGE